MLLNGADAICILHDEVVESTDPSIDGGNNFTASDQPVDVGGDADLNWFFVLALGNQRSTGIPLQY